MSTAIVQAVSTAVPSRDLTDVERLLLADAKSRYEAEMARALSERDRLICRLATDGASVVQIAECVGLTRQGVYDAIRRARERSSSNGD